MGVWHPISAKTAFRAIGFLSLPPASKRTQSSFLYLVVRAALIAVIVMSHFFFFSSSTLSLLVSFLVATLGPFERAGSGRNTMLLM